MKRLLAFVFFVVSTMVLLSGCAATKRVTVSPSFWQHKDQAIGVALVEIPRGNLKNFGSSIGNLAQQLKEQDRMATATAALRHRLRRTYPRNFARIQDLFVEKLKAAGFKVIKIEEKINLGELPKGKLASSEYPPKDYRPVGRKAAVDRLIVLQLSGFEVSCLFMGTYPQGTQINVQVRGEMIDVKFNKLLWRTQFAEGSFRRAVVGKCTEPADFPSIISSIMEDINKGVIFLYENFFGEKPSRS